MISPPWLALPPAGYGGIELVVSDLTEALSKRGHEVLLFAPGDSKSSARLFPTVPEALGQDYPLRVRTALFHATSKYAYARALLEGAELIHDHTQHYETEMPITAVHTLHGPAVPQTVELVRRMSATGRNHFVGISHRQRELFGEDGISWAGVVHNGIDVAAMPFAVEKEPYLFFIGRANWEKGLDLAVRVAGRAGRPLVMAIKMTEGHERAYYDEHVGPYVDKGNVTLLGEITPQEKFDLYARASGTLFTSQWEEPFGLVMPESMACGTPVLALPRGAAPEIIVDGETGFLCDDEDAMVEAVQSLSKIDPHRCRERVSQYFSVDSMTAGYLDVYQSLVHA